MGLVYSFQPSGVKATKAYAQVPNDTIADFTVVSDTDGTRVNKDGLIEQGAANVLRLDYSDGGCPVALLEPVSTNLVTDYLGITGFTITSDVTRTANYGISPDGTKNSTRLQFDTTTADNRTFVQSFDVTAGENYTFSFYAKRNDTNPIIDPSTSFQFQAGTSADPYLDVMAASIPVSSLTNEWKRYTTSGTMPSGMDKTRFHLRCDDNGVDIELYGIQLENLSYATSVIPTTSGVVTRSANTMETGNDLNNTINSVEGVLYVDMAALYSSSALDYRRVSLYNNSTNNRLTIEYTNNNNINIYGSAGTSGVVNTGYGTSPQDITDYNKIALRWTSAGEYTLWINGVNRANDTYTGTDLDGLQRISLPYCGYKIKAIKIYNTALTDAEMITLTTLGKI